tara:strand:+ start:753 stop:1235 length:483 start_codon:yes stop_codon:yes gene_type:complete
MKKDIKDLDATIKNIVNNTFKVDIDKRSRLRWVIDARRIYFAMLKLISPGRALRSIGNSLPNCKLNHATVLHSIRQLDSLLTQDINYFTKFEEISKDVKELIKAKHYINLAENYFESDVNVDYEYKPLPKIFNKRGQDSNCGYELYKGSISTVFCCTYTK